MKTTFVRILSILVPGMIVLSGCGQKGSNSSTRAENEPAEEWIQLFNGKDLNDWTIKMTGFPINENYLNTFRVEDGLLKVRYDNYDQFNGEFGHIYYKTPYSHYKLRVEYRVVGEQVEGGADWAFRNNGVMFHCQSPESILLDQQFPVSIEAQLLGGYDDAERTTGNLCTPGTNVVIDGELVTQHCINSTSETYRGEQWVTFELVVYGDSIIHHIVNGDTVLTYSKPQIGGGNGPQGYPLPDGTPVASGYIALQAESHPFDFRKVELLDLSK